MPFLNQIMEFQTNKVTKDGDVGHVTVLSFNYNENAFIVYEMKSCLNGKMNSGRHGSLIQEKRAHFSVSNTSKVLLYGGSKEM